MDSEAGLGRAPPPAPGSQSSSDMFGGQRPLCLRELSGQAAHITHAGRKLHAGEASSGSDASGLARACAHIQTWLPRAAAASAQ